MVSSDDWLMGNTKSNTPKHRWLFQPNLKENVTPKLIGSHHICICALGCHCWVCLQHLFFQPLWSYCAWFWLKTDYRRPTAAPIWTKKSTHHILRTRKMGHCKPSEGHECHGITTPYLPWIQSAGKLAPEVVTNSPPSIETTYLRKRSTSTSKR